MENLDFLAFDLGAGSGRGILGKFNGNKLVLEEIHRFTNEPVETLGNIYWDVLRLFWEIKQGIQRYSMQKHGKLASIGIDSWGVDFALLDRGGKLLANPSHYRDRRTDNMMELAFMKLRKEEIFKRTGIAFERFNTLYQLLSVCMEQPGMLDYADTLLFMSDIFAYFLTGNKSTDSTMAATSQLLNTYDKQWDNTIINTMGIPGGIFPEICKPGWAKGRVIPRISNELGIGQTPVIGVAGHDTSSAIAAIPVYCEGSYAFISSGTWSLMGVEADTPVTSEEALRLNFTNEISIGGYSLLRNIMGMWLIQECKRKWDTQSAQKLTYEEIEKLAQASKPFLAFIDPNDNMFYNPGDMPDKIKNFCKKTGQYVPQTKGEILRCILESLAFKYRNTFEDLERLTGKQLKMLHIIGGGIKNRALNQYTSNAIKRPVICGPVEATAIGNIMTQAMALGEISDLRQGREIIRASFLPEEYMPENMEQWDEAYIRFLKIQPEQ